MATADQHQDLPEGCAPSGSLIAYERAYAARYKRGEERSHLCAHLAGLRAVVLLDREEHSTPAPRTDGGMSAGEVEALAQKLYEADPGAPLVPWHDVWKTARENYRAMARAVAATPVQPAGAVPDGLRALSDIQFHMDDCDAGFAKVPRQRLAEWKALLSTHPAGQSAGSGAGRLTRSELEPHITSLSLWLMEHGGLGQWAAEIAAKRLLLSDDSPLCLKPAPVSTRTGQGEVDVRHIDVFGPVNGMNELDPSGSYMRLVLTKGEIREERLISLGAAEVFNAVLDGKLWAAGDSPLAARPAAPEAQGAEISQAVRDVLAHRRHQIEREGFTHWHDDAYLNQELAYAAACYAGPVWPSAEAKTAGEPPIGWPWTSEWWKPGDARSNLVKAVALGLAEIERIDRVTKPVELTFIAPDWRSAFVLLLPFVDHAAIMGMNFDADVHDGRPAMDAKLICGEAADALGIDYLEEEFTTLIEEGLRDIAAIGSALPPPSDKEA